jgi:hypothetical protein
MQAHPQIVLLGTAAEVIDESGTVIGRRSLPVSTAKLGHALRRSNPFIHSSVMIRAAPVRKLRGYRAAFLFAEDYDLWLRIAELGGVASLPEYLVQYRVHDTNQSWLQTVRQSFSVRLAQRSAWGRRTHGRDPAVTLDSPPDLWATNAETSFFSSDVGFYRFLEASKTTAVAYLSDVRRRFLKLNHLERKLAQLRLQQLFLELGRPLDLRQVEVAVLFAALHPPRALDLTFRYRQGAHKPAAKAG